MTRQDTCKSTMLEEAKVSAAIRTLTGWLKKGRSSSLTQVIFSDMSIPARSIMFCNEPEAQNGIVFTLFWCRSTVKTSSSRMS